MKTKAAVVLAIAVMLLPLVAGQYTITSISITVYADGYVKVVEVIQPENYTVSVTIPLLAANVEGLVVIDEKGSPLPYEINGSTLIVYFENATGIKITYYTPDLTVKNRAIWSVRVSSNIPVKITFPENAVIVDLSDIPLEINGNSIVMPAGNQTVSYVLEYLPAGTETAQTQTTQPISGTSASESFVNPTAPSTTGSSTETSSGGSTSWATIGILALLALAIGGFIYLKRGREESGSAPSISREDFEKRLTEYDLTKDEEKALLYLFDRGGKARQSEVRETLGIPKTTAWRMFQRLEKQGLVRVYKKKRENWVELRL
ncbi:helix-turn-helix domain-containing protein [Thermococcus sp. GR6]|uniref:helix-turn-helix transcriptional regulator n=1 Tax=Thermococcus sp. GR6 TaxID=1638256 RepID=UPI00142F6B80|nr:helix-turn-helix domain-containing protein [Thermococcus sp. GR6]NJE42214.1 hypothetical protein [Thermococcus sp. GR6]